MGKLEEVVREIVREELANLSDALMSAVRGDSSQMSAGQKAALTKKAAGAKTMAPKKPALKKSQEQMRCRFSDKSGHRCKKPSKGPRFHFLCPDHRSQSAPKKRSKK